MGLSLFVHKSVVFGEVNDLMSSISLGVEGLDEKIRVFAIGHGGS
jgi:hypothetical protein